VTDPGALAIIVAAFAALAGLMWLCEGVRA
jgi:hypothetical protein